MIQPRSLHIPSSLPLTPPTLALDADRSLGNNSNPSGAAIAFAACADGRLHMRSRLLICEDEPHIRNLLRYIAQQADCDCDVVSDGVSAVELLVPRRYDLILLDL